MGKKLVNRRRFNSGQHGRHHVLAKPRQSVEDRPRGRRQIEPLGAPIVRIGTALNQAPVAQTVDQPGQRDGLQVEHLG